MNIWDLERRIIDVIGVELQVARDDIGPESHIVDDLRADWLSMERLGAALETQLGFRMAPDLFAQLRVWDVVRECHNRYSGRESIADRNQTRCGRPRQVEKPSDELTVAFLFRPASAPLLGGFARRRVAGA